MRNEKFQNKGRITVRKVLKWLGAIILMMIAAVFMDWLLLNWFSGCCEGGICIPDFYPQCRNESYDQIYGEGYYEKHRN